MMPRSLRAPVRRLLAGGALAALLSATSAGAQTVETLSGPVTGATSAGVTSFKGIAYAAPPTGPNRWRAPQPAAAWSAPRDATHYGADCAQAPFPPDAAPIRTTPSEDCLYLNVWQPAGTRAGAKLPVMVWIHGGGFVNGGSSPAIYAGDSFARDGIVFVSLNYRLGRYGFFAHPGLKAEGGGGNFGYLDQIAALKWVQANIARFGGDPAHVTIAGESAGGMSMHMLLQSPLAQGLFEQAIVESGGGRSRTMAQPTIATSAAAGDIFAPGLNAAALRALPAATVTGDLSMLTMAKPGYAGPLVDGATILGEPLAAAKNGLDARVPVLIGANSADGFPFVTDKDKIFAGFGADAAEARRIYDPAASASGLQVGTATTADAMMIEPARAIARALAPRQPVYYYRFAFPVPGASQAMGGAPHASEIPYAFDTLAARTGAGPTAAETATATLMHAYWVNFVKTGTPDGPGLPVWPKASDTEADMVQVIDAKGARNEADPLTPRLDFAQKRAEAGTP